MIKAAYIKNNILDSRIRCISQPKRLEFAHHMNLCLATAIGDYVMILSDDDQLSPNYISSMVNAFQCLGLTPY